MRINENRFISRTGAFLWTLLRDFRTTDHLLWSPKQP